MIPGANLLKMALTIIAKQNILYYAYSGRTLNNVGQDVTTYAPPRLIGGSFQAVPRALYQQLGLDFQKEYYIFYTLENLLDVGRDVSGDQLAFDGQRYQCESNTDWFPMDGWKGVLCIRLGYDPTETNIFGFNAYNPAFPDLENTYTNFGFGNFLPRDT